MLVLKKEGMYTDLVGMTMARLCSPPLLGLVLRTFGGGEGNFICVK